MPGTNPITDYWVVKTYDGTTHRVSKEVMIRIRKWTEGLREYRMVGTSGGHEDRTIRNELTFSIEFRDIFGGMNVLFGNSIAGMFETNEALRAADIAHQKYLRDNEEKEF